MLPAYPPAHPYKRWKLFNRAQKTPFPLLLTFCNMRCPENWPKHLCVTLIQIFDHIWSCPRGWNTLQIAHIGGENWPNFFGHRARKYKKSLFRPPSCTFLYFLSSRNISLVISIAKNEFSCKKTQVIFLSSNDPRIWECLIRVCAELLALPCKIHPRTETRWQHFPPYLHLMAPVKVE